MKSITRYFRLLPAVFVVGTGLLALKGVDIARAAQEPAQASDEPDNSGLAPTDTGGGAPRRDFASDDTAASSAGEVDVLSSLTRRRAELDARERALNMRENLLSAGEGRVDQKIGALKNLQTQMQGLLAQRDAAQAAQIASLIKSYGPDGMKPAQAAAIFNTMPDEVLLPIAKGMKAGDLGNILAKMNPDAAQKLTVKLAALLKLPEATPAICPTTPGAQADLGMPPAGTAPPLQTAALSPPGSLPVVTPLPSPPVQAPPAQTAPPAPTPAAATPAPAPPTQASTLPKPHAPPVHHPAVIHPTTTPPAKPATASATPPAKPNPVVTLTPTAVPPPAKPTTAAVTPVPTPPAPTPTTPPAKPATQAASGPPVTIAPAPTPAPGG